MNESSRRTSGASTAAAAEARTMAGVRMQGVEAGYYSGHLVLQGVEIRAEPGNVTVILGPNGAGKSTVLKVMYGLVPPSAGTVWLDNRDVTHVPPHRRLSLGMAYLPQGHSVFPALSVEENLLLGLWMYRGNKAQVRRRLEQCYEEHPRLGQLRRKPAGSLSGGQQRLLEVARLTLTNPGVLLIDEPSVGVAPNLVDVLYDAIVRWRREGRTVVLVDQNVEAAVSIADYVYTLESGRNKLEGPREEFSSRLTEVVREWLHFNR
ncbi:MAG: ABC transporter ATP-binding protein [Alicyclobacillus sp.]|nr:ABC transporter ATP-binding protein [Alicyclobacillus sp.]